MYEFFRVENSLEVKENHNTWVKTTNSSNVNHKRLDNQISDDVYGIIREPVQVNSQCWDPHYGLLNPYKFMQIRNYPIFFFLCYHSSRKSQVSIKPCVPQATSVSLDANFQIPTFSYLQKAPFPKQGKTKSNLFPWTAHLLKIHIIVPKQWFTLETGLSLRQGLSVWAPTM